MIALDNNIENIRALLKCHSLFSDSECFDQEYCFLNSRFSKMTVLNLPTQRNTAKQWRKTIFALKIFSFLFCQKLSSNENLSSAGTSCLSTTFYVQDSKFS